MLSEIEQFVNWVRRRNPQAGAPGRTIPYDLQQFADLVEVRTQRNHHWRYRPLHQPAGFQRFQARHHQSPPGGRPLSLYTFLSDEDPSLVCPVLPHRHFLRQPQRLPRPVKEDDLRLFFAAIDHPHDRAMFILMLRCGLRISEVANLLMADLYLDESHPRLVAHGKGTRERSVYLSPQAERALRAYLAGRPAVGQRLRLPQLPGGRAVYHCYPQAPDALPGAGRGIPHRSLAYAIPSPTIWSRRMCPSPPSKS